MVASSGKMLGNDTLDRKYSFENGGTQLPLSNHVHFSRDLLSIGGRQHVPHMSRSLSVRQWETNVLPYAPNSMLMPGLGNNGQFAR